MTEKHSSPPGFSSPVARAGISRRGFISCSGALALAGLSGGTATEAQEPGGTSRFTPVVRVVATTAMLADPLRNFFPQGVLVDSILRPGIDPHLYVPVRKDIHQLLQADVVIYNGLNLEGKLQELIESSISRKIPIINACAPFQDTDAIAIGAGQYDPHMWVSPLLWRKVMEALRERVLSMFPHLTAVTPAADEYLNRLDRLVNYARQSLETIPESQRILVSAHSAFGYLGRDFDIHTVGIKGVSTQSDASVRRMREVIDIVLRNRIPSVFPETSTPSRLLSAVQEGVRLRGRSVSLALPLFSDAMGVPPTYEATYVGMQDHNFTNIAHGLGGLVPVRGMNDALSRKFLVRQA